VFPLLFFKEKKPGFFVPNTPTKVNGGGLECTKNDLLLFMSQLGKGWHLSFLWHQRHGTTCHEGKDQMLAKVMIIVPHPITKIAPETQGLENEIPFAQAFWQVPC